jgi:hypothetical protein
VQEFCGFKPSPMKLALEWNGPYLLLITKQFKYTEMVRCYVTLFSHLFSVLIPHLRLLKNTISAIEATFEVSYYKLLKVAKPSPSTSVYLIRLTYHRNAPQGTTTK